MSNALVRTPSLSQHRRPLAYLAGSGSGLGLAYWLPLVLGRVALQRCPELVRAAAAYFQGFPARPHDSGGESLPEGRLGSGAGHASHVGRATPGD